MDRRCLQTAGLHDPSPLISFKKPMNILVDPMITVLPVHLAWVSEQKVEADVVLEAVRSVAAFEAQA